VRSRSKVCSASLSTGWRDSKRFLRIIVIISQKPKIR
jgi:hypothetical protein